MPNCHNVCSHTGEGVRPQKGGLRKEVRKERQREQSAFIESATNSKHAGAVCL